MHLYRRFRTQAEIDAQYNLGARLADPQAVFDDYAARSDQARSTLRCESDVRYGPTLDERMDIFPAGRAGAPMLLFIHGGYWRAFSQREFGFVAAGFVPHGVTVAVVNYSLCPKVTIAEITRQNRAAVAWLRAHGARFHGDPARLWVMGHSAGAQQAAMLLGTDWRGEYGLPADTIRGGIALSGVYDLEPLRHSYLQPALQLDHDMIRRESPLLNVPRRAPPLLLEVGGREPEEFIRQSRALHRAWRAAGLTATLRVRRGDDHFSIIGDLGRPRSHHVAAILSVLGVRRRREQG
jgi:arylformamidase